MKGKTVVYKTITMYDTGHEIAATVLNKLAQSLSPYISIIIQRTSQPFVAKPNNINVAYGILRGTVECSQAAAEANEPFFFIDKGYLGAGHYNGYYRIALYDTQQPYDKMMGWTRAGKSILYNLDKLIGTNCLLCPPTNAVAKFHNINIDQWLADADKFCFRHRMNPVLRHKTTFSNKSNAYRAISDAELIYSHNSSMSWLAIVNGKLGLTTHHSSALSPIKNLIDTSDANMVNIPVNSIAITLSRNQFRLSQGEKAWQIMMHQLSL